MCSWIDREIEHIIEADITSPPEYNGEFGTRVEGEFLPVYWQRVYTRVQQLGRQRQALLDALGIDIIGEATPAAFVQLVRGVLGAQLASLTGRMVGLENALCDSLMAEHVLWGTVCVLIGSSWEVFYRTAEQEGEYVRYLAAQVEAERKVSVLNEGLFVNKSLDQNLN